MHTQVYDASVQFGAEIWATAMTERKIKDAMLRHACAGINRTGSAIRVSDIRRRNA